MNPAKLTRLLMRIDRVEKTQAHQSAKLEEARDRLVELENRRTQAIALALDPPEHLTQPDLLAEIVRTLATAEELEAINKIAERVG